MKHIYTLYQIIQSSSAVDKQKDWDEVEGRLKVQIPLRMLSCAQIASKLSSHSKVCATRRWGVGESRGYPTDLNNTGSRIQYILPIKF